MQTLENVSFVDNFDSPYLKAVEFSFKQGDRIRHYDLALQHASVAILLYHTERKEFLIVKQFRPAVFVNRIRQMPENFGKKLQEIDWKKYDAEIGYTLELCAGIVDKPLPLKEIAQEEIEEECGYKVHLDDIHPVASYVVGMDESGSPQQLYYAEIDESKKCGEGGGNVSEGEQITKVFVTVDEATRLSKSGPPGPALAFDWWIEGRKSHKDQIDKSKWPAGFPYNLETISDFHFKDNHTSNRFHPMRMKFTLNSLTRTWDLALRHNNSAILIYNKDTDELVLLQRFRPASLVGRTRHMNVNHRKRLPDIIWQNHRKDWVYTMEPCTGHYAPGESAEECARKIALTKCGYRVKELRLVKEFIVGISLGGDTQSLYYTQVDNGDRVNNFIDMEDIQRIHLPLSSLPSLVAHPEPVGPPSLYYGAKWIMKNVQRK